MAKRKKKPGGGFGSGEKPWPGSRPMHDFGGPPLNSGMVPGRGTDPSMKLIQKALISQGLQTPEELEKFLNERVVGKTIDELAAEFGSEQPITVLDRAEYVMDGLSEDASPAEIRRTARQALELSPYCVSAWLALGVVEEDPAKALELFEQGIEKGRVRFDGLIESLDAGQGIWGWIEARDFMRLLHQRAVVLEELGKFEDAVEVYQEMLALNPGDNQGIRGDLLRLLMVFRRISEGRALLDRFRADASVDMAYGRAFLSFVETMDLTGFDIEEIAKSKATDTPPKIIRRLRPEFDSAKKQLRQAVNINPFVPWMMTHPQLMQVDVDGLVTFGGPAEALVYSQKWALVWVSAVLPYFAITAQMESDPLRHAKSKHMELELLDLIDQLESFNHPPWWDGLMSED